MSGLNLNEDTIEVARQKLRERFGAATQVGGKGTARRKKRAQKPAGGIDLKKLQTITNRFRCQAFPAIGDITMMRSDGTCLHFANPKLQASVTSNTYIISGNGQEKKIKDLPRQVNQMDLSAFLNDPKFRKLLQDSQSGNAPNLQSNEEDDIPDLVENFEEIE
ncbi:NAC domain-containing protein [Cryptosporidium serpentis]